MRKLPSVAMLTRTALSVNLAGFLLIFFGLQIAPSPLSDVVNKAGNVIATCRDDILYTWPGEGIPDIMPSPGPPVPNGVPARSLWRASLARRDRRQSSLVGGNRFRRHAFVNHSADRARSPVGCTHCCARSSDRRLGRVRFIVTITSARVNCRPTVPPAQSFRWACSFAATLEAPRFAVHAIARYNGPAAAKHPRDVARPSPRSSIFFASRTCAGVSADGRPMC